MYAYSIVALMLLSISASFGGLIAQDDNTTTELADEPVQKEATSPGYPVFAEYMGAYWCGPCVTASNNLDALYGTNGGGGTQAEDFTFISFWESSSTGWPADSPINRRSHITNAPGYTGGIPVVVFGDADQGTYTLLEANHTIVSIRMVEIHKMGQIIPLLSFNLKMAI